MLSAVRSPSLRVAAGASYSSLYSAAVRSVSALRLLNPAGAAFDYDGRLSGADRSLTLC